MAVYQQFWDATKSFQITATATATLAAGTTRNEANMWLFNDRGSLLGATAMSGYYAVVEASIDGGITWLRSGTRGLNERWMEVSITGNVDNTGGAIAAQSTAYTAIGAGIALPLTTIPPGCGRELAARIVYPLGVSEALVQWRLLAEPVSAMEAWVTPPFAAGDFTASGAMLWTLQPGDVQTYAYRMRDSKTMVLSFTLLQTSTSGPLSNELRIKIPGGYVAAKTMADFALVYENSAHASAYCEVNPGVSYLSIFKYNAANYLASTNTLYVRGQLEFEVQ